MKVLIITRDFPPVLNSAARLLGQLAEDLSQLGHKVRVLTVIPKRYLVSPAKRHRARFVLREKLHGIWILRIEGLPTPRYFPMARGLEQVWMALSFLVVGLATLRPDAIIVYSPPFPLALTGYLLARLRRGVVIVNVQDLYPQTAVDLGLLGNRFLISLAEKLERFIYRKADAITVHSEGNREYVLRKGAPVSRVYVVPNWVDVESVRPGPRENGWRRLNGLEQSFIVSFAGTMGFAQGLEEVVRSADLLKQYPEIVFVLAGDGVFRSLLQQQAGEKGLRNIRFLPSQPLESYLELLQASDICLVTLHKDLRTPVVPGKLQSVMAAERPVICCANPASDARRIIEEAGCGFFVPAGNPAGLAEAVLTLYKSPELVHKMGHKGRCYAEQNFDRRRCTQAYDALLSRLKCTKEGVS